MRTELWMGRISELTNTGNDGIFPLYLHEMSRWNNFKKIETGNYEIMNLS